MRYFLSFIMVVAAFESCTAHNVGVQAIGLELFSPQDTDILAGQLASVRRPMELAVLPFEFRGASFAGTQPIGFNDPVFTNSKRVSTYALENNPSSFTLSIHLYFAHGGDGRPMFRYSAFQRNSTGGFINNAAQDISFREEIRARALRTAEFLNGLWAWANGKGIVSRLRLVTIPELEDSATPSQWIDCQRFIREVYATRGAITLFRRSVHGGDRSRPAGFYYEKHGQTSVIANIAAGDTYSNDGADIAYSDLPTTTSTTIKHSTFCSASAAAVRNGKSTLYWRNSFNGKRNVQPHLRGVLTPFTHTQYGAKEQTALWIYLNTF